MIFLRVARHGAVVGFEVAHGGFQIDDGGGGFAGGRGAPARAGAGDDEAAGEDGLHCVRAFALPVSAFARHAGFGGHVAADLVGQEHGRGGGGVAVDAAAVEIGFGDVDVDGLIVGFDGVFT